MHTMKYLPIHSIAYSHIFKVTTFVHIFCYNKIKFNEQRMKEKKTDGEEYKNIMAF